MLAPLLALALVQAPPTDDRAMVCHARFDELLAAKVFAAYPAPASLQKTQPIKPLVKHGRAHLYRTMIREGAAQGPNFAGHFTLIRLGCGAGTTCVAVADSRTGKVVFSRALQSATILLRDTGSADIDSLNFRLDSRLLIAIGVVNEDLRTEGVSYFVWRSGGFTRVRFTPATKLCSE